MNDQQFLHAWSEWSCEWLTYCIFSESRCQLADDGVGVFRPDGVQVEGPTSVWHWGLTNCQADQWGWGRESGSCSWGCQMSLWWITWSGGTTCTGSARAPSRWWWGGCEEAAPEMCETTGVSPSLWRGLTQGSSGQGSHWGPLWGSGCP